MLSKIRSGSSLHYLLLDKVAPCLYSPARPRVNQAEQWLAYPSIPGDSGFLTPLFQIYVEKYCLAGVENSTQLSAVRIDTKETPATKTVDVAAPKKIPRDICVLARLITLPYPRRNLSTYWNVLSIVTQEEKGHT